MHALLLLFIPFTYEPTDAEESFCIVCLTFTAYQVLYWCTKAVQRAERYGKSISFAKD